MTFRLFSKKRRFLSNRKLKAEARAMKQVLLNTCSFQSFCNYSEVFDMNKRAIITKRNNLFQLYAHGIGLDSPFFIVNKN